MMNRKNMLLLSAALSMSMMMACRTGSSTALDNAIAQTSSMTSAAGDTRNTLTDVDSGAIARTINDGEIQMAQLAVANASSQAVRDFAQMMITEHTTANTQLQTGGYGVAENPATMALNADVNTTMQMLRTKSGADFDRAYMDSNVRMHQMALNAMKSTLMPSARDPKLKGVLSMMSDATQRHLQMARDLSTTVGGAMGNNNMSGMQH